MRTLALAYLVTLLVYGAIGLVVALFVGHWGPVMLAQGASATIMIGFDYYGRWSSYKRQVRQIEAKKAFLRSMGIDVDAMQAAAKAQTPAPVAQGTN